MRRASDRIAAHTFLSSVRIPKQGARTARMPKENGRHFLAEIALSRELTTDNSQLIEMSFAIGISAIKPENLISGSVVKVIPMHCDNIGPKHLTL